MSRGYSAHRHPRREFSFTPYAFVLVGALTFCIAILGPVADLTAGLSLTSIATSGAPISFSGSVLVVSGGLLVISGASTLFGVLLLFVRLT
ncbi:hypothetical protein ACFQJC_03480 [Haloferax namakaokahaiae]|uniref:Cox cluster protein n=1 Tax=Haloferax namakaokahaiae TaxID=1748331 RepID=A0ABD5ZBL5_9EURY